MRLESLGSAAAGRVLTTIEPIVKHFNPLEARGFHGRWTSGRAGDSEFRKVQLKAEKKVRAAPTPTAEEVEQNRHLLATSRRAGGELRGNSEARAVRKQKLLEEFGDGKTAPCVYCGAKLDRHAVTEDKIFTAHEGGRYRMSNLLPACRSCNQRRGDKPIQLKWFQTAKQQRSESHRRIVKAILKGHEREEHPTALFLGGGPASGKSTVAGKKGAVIDIDDVMRRLPRYKEMQQAKDPKAAVANHAEASDLARKVRAAAYDKNTSFTLDGVGDTSPDRMRRVIKEAKAHGYRVEGRYFTVDTEEAVKRSDARGKQTGRYVPHSVIRNLHQAVSRTLPAVANEFDHLELYDNNGTEPRLILTKDEKGFHIHDPQAVQRFIDKGQVKKAAQGSPIKAARAAALGEDPAAHGHPDVVAEVRRRDGNVQLPYDYAEDA